MSPADRRVLAAALAPPQAHLSEALGQTDVTWETDAGASRPLRRVPVHVRLLNWEGRWLYVRVGNYKGRRFGPFRGRGWKAALLDRVCTEIEIKLSMIRRAHRRA